jgi:hypothetical protein
MRTRFVQVVREVDQLVQVTQEVIKNKLKKLSRFFLFFFKHFRTNDSLCERISSAIWYRKVIKLNFNRTIFMIFFFFSFLSSAGCELAKPSGFTRVAAYVPWILEHIATEKYVTPEEERENSQSSKS